MAIEALQSDVEVVISASTPVITQGLGTPAIFTKVTTPAEGFTPSLTQFSSSADVLQKFGGDSETTKVAQLIFAQANRPEHIDVIEYVEITSALALFQDDEWVFGLLADVSDTNEVIAFGGAIAEVSNKFGAVQVADASLLENFAGSNNIIGFVHPLDKGRLDAAVIGNVANLQPGEYTWKFRQVDGIAASGFTTSTLNGIRNAHGIAYVKAVGGAYMTSEGWTLSGQYIDDIHARIWIENQIKAGLQGLLINSKKLPYDSRGIIQIQTAIELVLANAYNLGIIAEDDKTGRAAYVVSATSRSEQTDSDVAQRIYKGAGFKYVQAGAIHNIVVSGQIVDSL